MYEAMRVWETDDWLIDEPPVVREYAGIWRDTDKVVYSTSLAEVSTARTRIERTFDPEAVRRLKEASDADLSIGGAAVAASETEATTASGCSSSAADSTPHPTLVGDEPLMLVEHFLHHVVSEASHDDDPAGSQTGHRTDEFEASSTTFLLQPKPRLVQGESQVAEGYVLRRRVGPGRDSSPASHP